jgi:hypothetical protein
LFGNWLKSCSETVLFQICLKFKLKKLQVCNLTVTYLDFVFEATQRTVEQTFAFQERLNGLAVDALKGGQVLSVERQEIAFEATEALQAQVYATSERVAETFKNFSVN